MLLEIFLRSLAQNTSLPWCILGGFNDIFDVREKWGVLQDPSGLSVVLDKRYMICVYGRINGYSSIYTSANPTSKTACLKPLISHRSLAEYSVFLTGI